MRPFLLYSNQYLCIDQFKTSKTLGIWTFEIAVGQIPGPWTEIAGQMLGNVY